MFTSGIHQKLNTVLEDMKFKAHYASTQQLDYGFSDLLSSFCPEKTKLLRDAVLEDNANVFDSEFLKASKVDPNFSSADDVILV